METNNSGELPLDKSVILQGILLEKNEVLIYTDEKGEKHMITSSPFDPEKEYRVLIYND